MAPPRPAKGRPQGRPSCPRKNLTPVLRVADILAEPLRPRPPAGRPTRLCLPPRGQAMNACSPDGGLKVRVEHRPDGSLVLMVPDRTGNATTVITYPLVVQPLAVPKQQLIRQRDGTHRIPPGMRQPMRLLIQDSTGRRVFHLVADDAGRIGSTHELGAKGYATDHMNPFQRLMRHQDKVRQAYPLQAGDMLNPNISIRQLLLRCPIGRHRTKFLAAIIRARHGPMHKGDLPALEEEITAAIDQHLRRHKRRWRIQAGPKPWKMPSSYVRTLKPFNEARWQYQAYEEIEQSEPGIGDRRYID